MASPWRGRTPRTSCGVGCGERCRRWSDRTRVASRPLPSGRVEATGRGVVCGPGALPQHNIGNRIKFMRRPPHTHSSRPESLYKSARAPGRRLKLTHTRSHRCADGKTGADPAPPLRRRMVPLVVSIARPRARVVRRIRGSHTHTRAQPSTHNTPFTPEGGEATRSSAIDPRQLATMLACVRSRGSPVWESRAGDAAGY